ncbi:Cell wall-associated hydrolase, NlpC family [Yoonia litorea]|uniref:Cell wall-associated hydrolase, NlpC family n=2 Tax=Yoonia litorea TaxID=1123755 RepID=A0A1I6L1W0_9RHOB|nr:Cell wall-associated hydrolase, NlpC family [Yoonia litorea]
MDRRLTPANGRVAALHLAGAVEAERYVAGVPMSVGDPVVDLCAEPDGPRDRQLLLGTRVTVFEERQGWSFVQAEDDYVGYVAASHLIPEATPTHFVATLATHAYEAEEFKSRDVLHLPFGARVTVVNERRRFFETTVGFVSKSHLRPLDRPMNDPVTVAQIHFGVPYLWGGNSSRGIDCSGLVSTSFRACGLPCPADSDMQRDGLGAEAQTPYERGDLVFWKGHVGLMVDDATLIHANAHHMATVYEPIERAVLRIAAQGDGDVIAHKRL